MRTFDLAAAVLATTAQSQEPKREPEPRKEENVTCSVDRLDKAWGLAVKSLTVREVSRDFVGGIKQGSALPYCEVWVTLAFAKVGDRKAVARAFSPFSNRAPVKDRPALAVFYLLDEDGVVIRKHYLERVEGEVTGAEGDAFRAVLMIEPETYKKAKKIDVRMSEAGE